MFKLRFDWYITCLHRMQIWRTTRSAPGTSCMKMSVVGPRRFVLSIGPNPRGCNSLQKKVTPALFSRNPHCESIERLWNVEFGQIIVCFADAFLRRQKTSTPKRSSEINKTFWRINRVSDAIVAAKLPCSLNHKASISQCQHFVKFPLSKVPLSKNSRNVLH